MPPFRNLYPQHFCITRRDEWGALRPKFTGKFWFPISYIHTSYTRTSNCVLPDICTKELLFMQHLHMKYSPDIKQNFLISESGRIFEGRGWLAKPGLPACYRDIQYTSLYIGYIGVFKESLPNQKMLKAKEDLIKFGIENDLIRKNVLDFNLDGKSLLENDGLCRY